ncbi:LptF/LptG family permease [Candidatus Pelagibacter sp. HIMB1321]|uniref:LptF/LptG family permease n=1 Tax=Candidatus Pelagibacter sp. HIMB1321 TaxID=1388755 RepID=UPI000A07F452|nr:LptF/LptG family permease [Candidatus Pelagibacter sp. HIMB1321]SMF72410.1 lipopolysaccharide export system permease protein [Candidatus Pelagibacter sp. HIMB1321]
MIVYKKFLFKSYLKSLLLIFLIFFSLIYILSIITELDFFKDSNVSILIPTYLALINTPDLIFELFPFIFLIGTMHFFLSLKENDEIKTFKYFGLKNTQIIKLISQLSLVISILIVTIYYSASSNLKNIYLITKSKYTDDDKYLAVITKNGLWIKDVVKSKTLMINAAGIEQNYLLDIFISEFDQNFNVIRNIQSSKVDISNKNWKLFDVKIFKDNNEIILKDGLIKTNYDYETIQNLFSNLSSLSLLELFEMRKNYIRLNYSVLDINIHILKVVLAPVIFLLIMIFGSILSFNSQKNNKFFSFSIGLIFSVCFYYITVFLTTLASTEKLNIIASMLIPIVLLIIINSYYLFYVNKK